MGRGEVSSMWINMSAVHSCSPSLSPSLSHLFFSQLTSFLIFLVFYIHLCPELNSFFFTYPSFYALSLPLYFKSCFQSVNQSTPQRPPFPTFLSHGQLPFYKSIFLTLYQCLHHFSPSPISFFLMKQSSLFPLSFSLVRMWNSISVHY